MLCLVCAHLFVKQLRLSRWRRTLGRLVTAPEASGVPFAAHLQAQARSLAASMARADWRLPLATKCLARAVALQWRLRASGVSSLLVIAVHVTDRTGEHAFHAWVERDGDILIGHCDRASYHPIMIFAQGIPPSAVCASSAQ